MCVFNLYRKKIFNVIEKYLRAGLMHLQTITLISSYCEFLQGFKSLNFTLIKHAHRVQYFLFQGEKILDHHPSLEESGSSLKYLILIIIIE